MQKEDRITHKAGFLNSKQCYNAMPADFDDIADMDTAVYNRLGEYEDTGLSPKEVEELKQENDRLWSQIASLEDQLKKALAAEGHKIKCEIHITVDGLRKRDACQNDGKKKQRIPWEAD